MKNGAVPTISVCIELKAISDGIADDIIAVPEVHDCVKTVVATIPIQMLAYYVALERGCDVDKPRNLAKAVTVE